MSVQSPPRPVARHSVRYASSAPAVEPQSLWLVHLGLLAMATVLWVFSVRAVRLEDMGGLGLLDALPATYFVAIAVLTLGFLIAHAQDRVHPALLWMYVVALIWVLHGTTPFLYDEPRYSWTYKHLGVINVIAASGVADRSVDIYMNWPGFFVLNAWFSRVSGVAPIHYAEWSQVFFGVANVLALRFALRALTDDDRLIWRATWLFVLGNWVGQDYLAPQAMGFLLSLVVIGLCLRGAVSAPRSARDRRWRRRLDALGARLGAGPVASCPPGAVLPSRERLVGGALCYAAIVVSHQLSPVMATMAAAAIWLLTRRIPWWVPVGMAALDLAWLVPAWPYINGRFDLLSFDPFQLPGGHYPRSRALAGFDWVTPASFSLSVILAALALVGLIRRLRAGHWDLAGVGLVAAAALIVLGQDYGGEIVLRVYLFGLPWLAFFAAAALQPTRTPWPSLRAQWRLAGAAAVLTPLLLVAYFGPELQNRTDADDVAISAWYEEHAPAGSLLLFVMPNVPNRLTERYPKLLIPSEDYNPNLTDRPGFRADGIGPEDVPAIAQTIEENRAPHSFIVVSPSEERSARLYGLLREHSFKSFERALTAHGRFRLVKSIGRARLYEYGR